MKTSLGFLTEEGRTRSKNTFRRVFGYAALMLVVGAASTYAIHRYWIRSNLTPLQSIYFRQYLRSAFKAALPGAPRSGYITLARTVADRRTKRDVTLAVSDAEIVPALDEEGNMRRTGEGYPLVYLKPGIEQKRFYWMQTINRDAEMYAWFRKNIYEGQGLLEIYRPAWLGGLFVFLLGTGALSTLDLAAQRRYMRGQALRGTRQLAPQEYAREHRWESGYGVKVYAQGRRK